jgi:hypothetical protein
VSGPCDAPRGGTTHVEEITRRRERTIHLLKVLADEGLARVYVPDLARITPSFSTPTCEPDAPVADIDRRMGERGFHVACERAPVGLPIYRHEAYRHHVAQRRHADRCPVAEEQCLRRVQLKFSGDGGTL